MLGRIYSGGMPPGAVINEVVNAREFGVSRGSVLEAVWRLQGIQIVTREPYLKARVVELSAESALELFQTRMVLEGVACYLATERMSDEEIDQLLPPSVRILSTCCVSTVAIPVPCLNARKLRAMSTGRL